MNKSHAHKALRLRITSTFPVSLHSRRAITLAASRATPVRRLNTPSSGRPRHLSAYFRTGEPVADDYRSDADGFGDAIGPLPRDKQPGDRQTAPRADTTSNAQRSCFVRNKYCGSATSPLRVIHDDSAPSSVMAALPRGCCRRVATSMRAAFCRSRSAMASGLAGYRSRTAAGEISRSGGGRIIDPKGRPRWPWEAVIALARRPLSPLGASSLGSLNAAGRAAFAYAVRVIGAAQTGWRPWRECWPARLVFPW